VDWRGDETVRHREGIAALDAIAARHDDPRGLPRMLPNREHDLGREGHAPDRQPCGEMFPFRRVNAVQESKEIHVRFNSSVKSVL
jgi:hypothetical protein